MKNLFYAELTKNREHNENQNMNIFANCLITIVALLHFYFLLLEMVFWTKPLGLKAFRQTLQRAEDTKVLAANQGLYNGFLVAGLCWSLFTPNIDMAMPLAVFFLSCVVVAGVFGAMTVSRKIFVIQAVPALLALGALYLKDFFN
ncbi:hypothetical protein D3C87_242120 [compost metagenome]